MGLSVGVLVGDLSVLLSGLTTLIISLNWTFHVNISLRFLGVISLACISYCSLTYCSLA